MTVYLWDGSHIVGEQRTGKPVQFYLRGHNLIARQHDGVLDYYLLNEHGDVTYLRDQSGSRIASYRYDAFGQEKEPWEEDENPFRYCGEYFDTETNTVYLRNRDYRSSTGRFTQEDPIRDGGNWYNYASNNPVMFCDPSGLINYKTQSHLFALGFLKESFTTTLKSLPFVNFVTPEETTAMWQAVEQFIDTLSSADPEIIRDYFLESAKDAFAGDILYLIDNRQMFEQGYKLTDEQAEELGAITARGLQ